MLTGLSTHPVYEWSLCLHSLAGTLHQAGNLELKDCWSHWCVPCTPPLPGSLFKPVLSPQGQNKAGIQRLKKALKKFHADGVEAAAGGFKGRLWTTHPGGAANPAQPGRRGIMEPPLCFWTDGLGRAVGVLVKCWLSRQDLEDPFGTGFSSPCHSQPCFLIHPWSPWPSRPCYHRCCQHGSPRHVGGRARWWGKPTPLLLLLKAVVIRESLSPLSHSLPPSQQHRLF